MSTDTNELRVDLFDPQLDELAPGLFGYTVETNGELYVPLVLAETPGTGACSRYLDSLPRDRTVKFPTVLSSILAGALRRRGFTLRSEQITDGPLAGEWADVWVRDGQ